MCVCEGNIANIVVCVYVKVILLCVCAGIIDVCVCVKVILLFTCVCAGNMVVCVYEEKI